MYKNYHLWDQLSTCVLGQYYSPEHYSDVFLARSVEKTQEELLTIEQTLQKTGITVLKPCQDPVVDLSLHPPISPAHHLVMLGTVLYETHSYHGPFKTKIDWPANVDHRYQSLFDHVRSQGNTVKSVQHDQINSASIYPMQKNAVRSKWTKPLDFEAINWITFHKPDHLDQQFCIPAPGLIISMPDHKNPQLLRLFYKTYFPDYQVYYLSPGQKQPPSVLEWQKKNNRSNNLNKFVTDTGANQTKWRASKSLGNIQVLDQFKTMLSFRDAALESILARYSVEVIHCNITYQALLHINLGCLITALDRS